MDKVNGASSHLSSIMSLLAVFDNDGTICDSQGAEDSCFVHAIEKVTGKSLQSCDWGDYEEPTSSAITRHIIGNDPDAPRKEEAIKREFVRLLELARPTNPGDFVPIPGAIQFIQRLKAEAHCPVAIATGCFDASARFKLQCCGITLADFPHASSSDTPRRRDIILLAAKRAGFDVSSVVYFGDAPWDVRVSTQLGIPMIGIGRRIEQLRVLGVRHLFRDYMNTDPVIQALHDLHKKSNRHL